MSMHAIDCRRLSLAFIAVLIVALGAGAQDGEAEPGDAEGAADETVPASAALTEETPAWEVPLDALELALLPLRKAELEAECERWITLLRDKTQELTEAKFARNAATDEASLRELRARVTEVELQKAALTDRCHLVLNAFEAKGGDPDEYERYVAAVGGLAIDVTDASTAWMQFRAWLVSEDGGQKWLWAIVKFFAILLAFWILARIVGAIVKRAVAHVKGTSELLRTFLAGLTRKVILIIGAVVAVGALGVDIGPLVAAIGAAGLVIGFALQGTLSNFASGIMILMYKPYDIGHYIEAGGVSGTVENMTLVSTTLVTPDNATIIVPNNSVWGDTIKNITGRSTRRVDMTFGISYSDDIDKAKEVLLDIVRSHKLVLDDPPINIQVTELADSSVNFIVRPWVKTSDYWEVYWDLHAEVKRRFDKEGIGIPFPQMDVHVHQEEARRDEGT